MWLSIVVFYTLVGYLFVFCAIGRMGYSLCTPAITVNGIGDGVCTVENHNVNHNGYAILDVLFILSA